MKKRNLILIITIALVLYGCSNNKEITENTSADNIETQLPTENKENIVESGDLKNKGSEENIGDTDLTEEESEEIIGDVDLTDEESILNMEKMIDMKIGEDLVFTESKDDLISLFGKDIIIPFAPGSHITYQNNDTNVADQKNVRLAASIMYSQSDSYIRKTTNATEYSKKDSDIYGEQIGDYIVRKIRESSSKVASNNDYELINTKNGICIQIFISHIYTESFENDKDTLEFAQEYNDVIWEYLINSVK